MTEAFGLTDTGCVRANNEDCYLIDPDLGLYLLADGMGGAKAGERASELAVQTIARIFSETSQRDAQALLRAVETANNRVLELEEQLRSMEEGDRSRSARSGGFLDSFWGGRGGQESRSSVPQVGARATPSAYDSRGDGRSPWAQSVPAPQQPQPPPAAASGGFMRSALTTAAGVAGGMLVADSIRNMLGGGAHATPHHDAGGGGGARTEDARYVDDKDNDPGNDPGNNEDDGNDPGFDSGGGDEIEI